jgi:hypothetical protein
MEQFNHLFHEKYKLDNLHIIIDRYLDIHLNKRYFI